MELLNTLQCITSLSKIYRWEYLQRHKDFLNKKARVGEESQIHELAAMLPANDIFVNNW